MFTGIIETIGTITQVSTEGTNQLYWIESPISDELKIDQSVSHDGVCLTVDSLEPGRHRVTAISETLKKTNLETWKPGYQVNIERCMRLNDRLDGHIVQGHVDCTAVCLSKNERSGSWEYRFRIPDSFAALIIEKGSISVNGTSLTVFNVSVNEFAIAIIPYTYEHTTIKQVEPEHLVNIEFDIIGKYVHRLNSLNR